MSFVFRSSLIHVKLTLYTCKVQKLFFQNGFTVVLMAFIIPLPLHPITPSPSLIYYIHIYPCFRFSNLLHWLVFISRQKFHMSKQYSFLMGFDNLEREIPSLFPSLFSQSFLFFYNSTKIMGSAFQIVAKIWLNWL